MNVNNRVGIIKLKERIERLVGWMVMKNARRIRRDKKIQREIKICGKEFKRLYQKDDAEWDEYLLHYLKYLGWTSNL